MAAVEEQQHAGAMEEDSEPTEAEKAQMEMRKRIMKIMMDSTLTDAEKAQRRQDLMSGKWSEDQEDKPAAGGKKEAAKKAADSKSAGKKSDILEDTLKCVICFNLCERPVTGPCQHNFCLACFKRWLGQGKKTCPTCRAGFPAKFCDNPRINTLLTYAIRCAKQGIKDSAPKAYNRIADESRPAEAFTTERAVRSGRANAASGRIMVNVPNDHFGPILPEHDPVNGKGVQVGDWWKDRLDCRQWGAHFPHVAGIAGQSTRGAQSVVLSGGYEDDHDEGEWFLYTGSGGRDLSGNKRTNKTQSFDQTFDNMNAALKLSCLRGLPVRVVRSFKEKRSSYAPGVETPVRYDGIYRILRCWRKKGAQGFLMCRYLFVRCDNAPAPWTSDETGDSPRMEVPDLAAKEIKQAQGQVFSMSDKPFWDYDADKSAWVWAREAPASQKAPGGGDAVKKLKKKASAHERLLRDFSCSLCKGVLQQPLSMPCGHNFCKGCLDTRFAEAEAAQAQALGSKALADAKPARSLRVRKVPKPCPTCKTDLADCLHHAAINTEMAELIRRLQEGAEEARRQAAEEAAEAADAAGTGDAGAGSSKAAAAAAAGEDAADSDAADDDDEGEQEEGGSSEGEEEDAAAAAGPSSSKQQPAKKRQRVAAVASKESAAAAEDTAAAAKDEARPAAAAEGEAGPSNGSAPAAAQQQGGAGRYASEVADLSESFPDFDAELIAGLLEDQGGDVEEVHAYLKRMKRQLAAANRPPKQPSAASGGKAKGKKGKGSGKKAGSTAAAAEAADGAAEEQEGGTAAEEKVAAAADADAEMADAGDAAAASARDGAADGGAAASDLTDTQLGSDTDISRKQQGGQKVAAAAAAAEDGSSKGRKKRAAPASTEGSKAKKRAVK